MSRKRKHGEERITVVQTTNKHIELEFEKHQIRLPRVEHPPGLFKVNSEHLFLPSEDMKLEYNQCLASAWNVLMPASCAYLLPNGKRHTSQDLKSFAVRPSEVVVKAPLPTLANQEADLVAADRIMRSARFLKKLMVHPYFEPGDLVHCTRWWRDKDQWVTLRCNDFRLFRQGMAPLRSRDGKTTLTMDPNLANEYISACRFFNSITRETLSVSRVFESAHEDAVIDKTIRDKRIVSETTDEPNKHTLSFWRV